MSALQQTEPRIANIIDVADIQSKETIRHEFTQQELDQMREKLSTNLIQIDRLRVEMADVVQGFKDKLKPIEKENRDMLQNIRLGFEEAEMNVYGVRDIETGLMRWYDADGDCVGQRRLYPGERQYSIR